MSELSLDVDLLTGLGGNLEGHSVLEDNVVSSSGSDGLSQDSLSSFLVVISDFESVDTMEASMVSSKSEEVFLAISLQENETLLQALGKDGLA